MKINKVNDHCGDCPEAMTVGNQNWMQPQGNTKPQSQKIFKEDKPDKRKRPRNKKVARYT